MVMWKIPEPWLGLRENGPKLYTNFEFCEEEFHKLFENILIYKAMQFILTKSFQ